MRRLNIIARITLGLVSLTVALVLVCDLVFGLIPSDADALRNLRQRVSENLSVQVATLLQARDLALVSRTLQGVRSRDRDILSIAVRRADGVTVVASGEHATHWVAPKTDASTITHVMVPIVADGRRWGALEISYRSIWERSLSEWLSGGTFGLILILTVAGGLVFYLYLRRVLQHLDPSSAVPDRVRMAFDTLTEGVLIVDAKGRIVLSNASFRTLGGSSTDDLVGRKPEDIPWLAQALEDDEDAVPWLSAMQARQPVRGRPLNIEQQGRAARRAILNCAPVIDGTGVARGCMVTFNDVTQLEQAHEQLLDALAELASSKQQLEVRNDELQNLASRDPLSGCLNRRAFFGGLEVMFRDARQKGRDLACIICDGDWFKSINDNYGHAVGDLVIAAIGRILSESVRQSDMVCRYGGEEFCVALPGMSDEGAVRLAERLRARIEAECAASIPALRGATMTASFGVSSMTSRPESSLALVDQADKALYAAKRAGRNRVADYASLDEAEDVHAAESPAN